MPLGGDQGQSVIVRYVTVTRGEVPLRFECAPAFNYASESHEGIDAASGIRFQTKNSGGLLIQSDGHLAAQGERAVSEFTLKAGARANFVLTYVRDSSQQPRWTPEAGDELLESTVQYWRAWVAGCTYHGRWRETVVRSALILKLLTYEPTGTIVAAATFGLPEEIGGVRNWDYRYTWLRDAALTLNAFQRLGYRDEAIRFLFWLKGLTANGQFTGKLQIMYGVDAEHDLEEKEIRTLKGYRGSQPVRVGNAAHSQLQLDVYGALVSVAFFEVHAGMMVEYDRWKIVRAVLDSLSKIWDKPEQGIWEVRGEPRNFLHSRLMCWVAFDRIIKIARMRSLPAPLQEWVETRDRIYESIHSDFWNEEQKSFVQYQNGTELDASTLLMPQLEFISPADPRWLNSLKAITKKLIQDRAVMRYDASSGVDGLPGGEGSFTPCSFWYIQALTLTGEVERARLIFDKMLGYANHLGLYAEELGLSGEHLGNFPQALTHLSLIQCALTLNDVLERKDTLKPLQVGTVGQTTSCTQTAT